jgi:outer membrane protein TolC
LTVNGTPAFVGSPATTSALVATTGGLGDAYQVMKNFDFPNYGIRFDLTIPIRNRSAQADNTRALLEQRQSETRLRQLQNGVVVEVRNAQIALEQNRARVAAAQKSRELQERTLDAEQKKYQLGASTIFLVIQAQRDLAQARSVEVRALTDLMKAKIEFERALGRTLGANNIQIAGVQRGQIIRDTNIPGDVDAQIEAVQTKGKF